MLSEIRGVRVTHIAFLPIFPYKTPKTKVLSCNKPTAQGLDIHCRMLAVIPCSSRRSKLVPFASAVFVRELRPPTKIAQIFIYGNCLHILYTMLPHSASDLDQRWLKVRHFEPFGGTNNVPLNFGSQTLKFWESKSPKN